MCQPHQFHRPVVIGSRLIDSGGGAFHVAASMWSAEPDQQKAVPASSCVVVVPITPHHGKTFSNYQRISRKAICIRKMNRADELLGRTDTRSATDIDKSSSESPGLYLPHHHRQHNATRRFQLHFDGTLAQPSHDNVMWMSVLKYRVSYIRDGAKLLKWPRFNAVYWK